MTISSTVTRVQYSGNGATVSFPITFAFWDADDLTVTLAVTATGVETTWTRGTQFTVTGGAGSTGTLTVETSPTDYTPASGYTLTIESALDYTQPTAFPAGGSFPSASVEQQLDQTVRQIQQLSKLLVRALRQPVADASDIDFLPAKVTRASKYLAFDSDGDPVATAGTTDATVISTFAGTVVDDTTADAMVQTLVAALTAETAPATGDVVLLGDVSEGAGNKMTLANLLLVINALTQDTSPDRTADFAVTYDASAAAAKKVVLRDLGRIAQVANTQTGAVATGTTTIPLDDTIPQNTEGDLYITAAAFTPTNASSTLIIDVVVNASNSASVALIAALFQDSTASALAVASANNNAATARVCLSFRHKMTAGTTSATTFKVRIGGSGAGTTTFNGSGAAREFGGVLASSITITELLP